MPSPDLIRGSSRAFGDYPADVSLGYTGQSPNQVRGHAQRKRSACIWASPERSFSLPAKRKFRLRSGKFRLRNVFVSHALRQTLEIILVLEAAKIYRFRCFNVINDLRPILFRAFSPGRFPVVGRRSVPVFSTEDSRYHRFVFLENKIPVMSPSGLKHPLRRLPPPLVMPGLEQAHSRASGRR